jgi:serine/threonine protein kinase
MFGFSNNQKGEASLFEKYSIDFNHKYGEGGYGATYACKEKASGEDRAVKIVDTRRMKKESVQKESKIMETLTHQNIIHVYDHSIGAGKHSHLYFIFMDVAGGGELFDQVIDRGANTMSEEIARGFICQMLDGVAYCHLAGVAHRDLKLENVLLTKEGRVKVIDFGLSHVYPRLADGTIDRTKPLKDVCGSKSYAAPEVLAANGYDGFAADIWSLGVCLFAMLSGFFPLDEASGNDWRYGKLVEAQKGGRSTTHVVYSWYRRKAGHLSPEVVHLLDGLLNIDPNKRLTMAAIREHPWINAKKFADMSQGTYNVNAEVGEDQPMYRGGLGMGDEVEMMIDEDEAPVYRSLGGGAPEPPAMPGLMRQKAQLNLFESPVSGFDALDALTVQ